MDEVLCQVRCEDCGRMIMSDGFNMAEETKPPSIFFVGSPETASITENRPSNQPSTSDCQAEC